MATDDIAVMTDLQRVLVRQREAYLTDGFPEVAVRRDRLDRLQAVIVDNRKAIEDALIEDFGVRSRNETLALEVFSCIDETRHTRRHFAKWMKSERRQVSLTSWPGRNRLVKQPLGVIGIVVPWNYPLYLAVSPLVGALAAGNRAMVKMSEYTPAFSALFARMMAQAFREDEVFVVLGGTDVAHVFSSLPFDHLLFTGSTTVGRLVMQAAAPNLTPVTLELGGKSPTIIAPDASIPRAAKQIMFGKLCNAGQTCIAPDYVMVPRGKEAEFIAHAKQATMHFYPRLDGNSDYTCVVNERQAQRLRRYVEDAKARGAVAHPLHDETTAPGQRQVTPLAFTNVDDDMLLMQEEIFGPLLPVVPYGDIDQAIGYVNFHPRPLALYVFSDDGQIVDSVLRRTTSGGAVVNDVMMHVIQNDMPFGGVGPSGMGHYHGKEGFDTFSKLKGVFYQSRLNGAFLLYPPRDNGRLRRMMEFLTRR